MARYWLHIEMLLIWFCDVSLSSSQLLSVVQVFRHGERTPIVFYPNDPYQDSGKYWNGLSPGALTENGQHQLYELGKFFRARYDSFVGDEYKNNELVVKSSNSNRNFQSARSFLKGLFENKDLEIPIEKAKWPIMSALVMCAKFDIEYLKLEESNKDFMLSNIKNKEVNEYIRKHSEFPIFGLVSSFLIWDVLSIEHQAKLPLPEWTKTIYPEYLNEISRNLSRLLCYNKEQQKLGVGPFINELIEHFEKIIEDPSNEPKTHLYSGHDINLACFLSTFEYYQKTSNPHIPPFASSLIFELRKNIKNEYFVNVYYKPGGEAIPLKVKNCEFDCSLEKFKKIFEDIRITKEKWYSECYYL